MKPNVLFLFVYLSCCFGSYAQDVIIKKYKTGEIASKESKIKWPNRMREDFLEEKVEVFNKKGEKVFEGYRRDFAGHASVDLTYHQNGGVSRIETSNAPDAGIQWYKSTYTLDEDGNVTSFQEFSHDSRPNLTLVQTPDFKLLREKEEQRMLQEQEEKKAKEQAAPLTTQLVLYNHTKKTVEVSLSYKSDEANWGFTTKIAPKDSLATMEISRSEAFSDPQHVVVLTIKRKKSKESETINLSELPMKVYDKNKQHKVYQYYLIE